LPGSFVRCGNLHLLFVSFLEAERGVFFRRVFFYERALT
jgi:hypothetical protein